MMIFLTLMAAVAAEPPRRCMLQAWSNDTDPAGLRVHAGPGLATPEIGRLPAAIDGDEHYAPNFNIVDVRDGWVKIADADDTDNPGKPPAVFRGPGWVHGSRVVFTVQSDTGRAGPSVRAKVVVKASDWLGDAGGAQAADRGQFRRLGAAAVHHPGGSTHADGAPLRRRLVRWDRGPDHFGESTKSTLVVTTLVLVPAMTGGGAACGLIA